MLHAEHELLHRHLAWEADAGGAEPHQIGPQPQAQGPAIAIFGLPLARLSHQAYEIVPPTPKVPRWERATCAITPELPNQLSAITRGGGSRRHRRPQLRQHLLALEPLPLLPEVTPLGLLRSCLHGTLASLFGMLGAGSWATPPACCFTACVRWRRP